MKRRCKGIGLLVILIICLTFFIGLNQCEKKSRTQDPYELLTILGDVSARPSDVPGGRWRPARNEGVIALTREEQEKLEALPYMSGSVVAPDVSNVTIYDVDNAFHGLNLYASGHGPEAFLIDMDGNILHKWHFPIERIWPNVPHTVHSTFWRRVHGFPNGDLLVIFEGIGMLKLNKDSKLLWSFKGATHHEAFVSGSGDIYVLTRQGQILQRINPFNPVLLDTVTVLSKSGEVKNKVPILEAFENSNYNYLLKDILDQGDIFHTNSVYVFDGSYEHFSSLFKKGNVLTSLYKLDVIAIIDMDKQQVIWAYSGRPDKWLRQHDPTPLPNGNILIFDNLGRNGKSRVVEFNLKTHDLIWQYPKQAGIELYSKTCGTSDRLPNGNTLITESDNGRALEIMPDGRIVWEFYNPHRAGDNNELIATLFELSRIDKHYVQWLNI